MKRTVRMGYISNEKYSIVSLKKIKMEIRKIIERVNK